MEVLATLNKLLREEHGNPIGIDNTWKNAGVDSFGTTMVLCDMDEKYGCFPKEWFSTVDWDTLTIREIVERVDNAGTIV